METVVIIIVSAIVSLIILSVIIKISVKNAIEEIYNETLFIDVIALLHVQSKITDDTKLGNLFIAYKEARRELRSEIKRLESKSDK